MAQIDYDGPVAITRDIFWVGAFDAEADLHCNPYLIVDGDEAVLIDSGSIPQFPVIMRKIIDVINPSALSLLVATHQDPDVCSNMVVVEDIVERSDLRIAAHSATLRLVRHFGVRSMFYPVDAHQWKYTLKSGRTLEFIHTPHLHCAGSIAVFDTATRTLFSSDIFGAVDQHWDLFATSAYPSESDSWHELMMPANSMLRACMERFEKLAIARICPQHGSVIEGDLVPAAIAHLKELRCGLDLME